MSSVKACRACLSVNVKLHDITETRLDEAFETATGVTIPQNDSFPRYLCSFCCKLTQNCRRFQRQCLAAQGAMADVLTLNGILTLQMITSIDIKVKDLTYGLSTSDTQIYNITQEIDVPLLAPAEIKVETLNTQKDPFKIEDPESDTDVKWSPPPAEPEPFYPELDEESAQDIADDQPLSVITRQRSATKRPKPVKKKVVAKRKKPEKVKKAVTKVKKSETSKKVAKTKKVESKRKQFVLDENIEVVLLTKEQQLEEIRARKESNNYNISVYKCDRCFKGFLQEKAYLNHMSFHDIASGLFLCDVCLMRFPTKIKLNAHQKITHNKKFICKICKNEDRSIQHANIHQRFHRGVTYDCDKCGKTFKKKQSLSSHLRTRHRTEHVCACGESFVSALGLAGHRRLAHRSPDEKIERAPYCESCQVRFRSPAALDAHRLTSSKHTRVGAAFHHCRECGASFQLKCLLRDHLKSAHADSPDTIKCKKCDKTYYGVHQYTTHFRRHHFERADAARRGGDAQRPYVCELCGKKFACQIKLTYHQLSHRGEKPYKCAYCEKSFTTPDYKLIHERIHTGDRPYQCPECPKAFKDRGSLNRHSMVHTGEKPYACSYCGKCFSQSNSMKLHVATVHHKLPAPYKHKSREVPR